MTDNIQKLYEIAGVYLCNMPDIDCSKECEKCVDYNPFTAEKQLELIKWITKVNEGLYLEIGKNTYDYYSFYFGYLRWTDTFEQGLCGLILRLWEEDKLTDDQKQEIKRIIR